jgi:hypothetical protein
MCSSGGTRTQYIPKPEEEGEVKAPEPMKSPERGSHEGDDEKKKKKGKDALRIDRAPQTGLYINQ